MSLTYPVAACSGKGSHWAYYLLGTFVVAIAFVIGQQPLELWRIYRTSQGRLTQTQYNAFLTTGDFSQIGMSPTAGLLFLLVAFVCALGALALVMRFIHGRPFSGLIRAGAIQWRKVGFAAALWFALTAAFEVIAWRLAPESYSWTFTWSTWLPLILVSLTILPLQTSFEELFVRSYLLQRISVGLGRTWIAIVVTAIVFASMHWFNPEVREFGRGIMMTYYISVAVFLGVITIIDDGLEYALGIHAATNIYGAGFVSYTGSALQMDSMIHADQVDAYQMTGFFVLSAVCFVLIMRFRHGKLQWRYLFNHISCEGSNDTLLSSP